MFIDVHAHAYLWPCPPQDGRAVFCKPEEVIARYDELGIERGYLMPLIGPEVYLPQGNEEILEISRRYPDRFFCACNIDPRGIGNAADTDFSPWLDFYRDAGCRGVAEFMPNLPFTHPLVWNLFRQLEERDFPVTFDIADRMGGTYGLYDEPGLPYLEQTLRRFPRLRIFGHGPSFWSQIGRLRTPAERGVYPTDPVDEEGVVPVLFRRHENLWGDLSAGSGYHALARDEGYAARFLTEFQDRLCFGTDICGANQPLPLAALLIRLRGSGKISDGVFRKIARENAIRAFRL